MISFPDAWCVQKNKKIQQNQIDTDRVLTFDSVATKIMELADRTRCKENR